MRHTHSERVDEWLIRSPSVDSLRSPFVPVYTWVTMTLCISYNSPNLWRCRSPVPLSSHRTEVVQSAQERPFLQRLLSFNPRKQTTKWLEPKREDLTPRLPVEYMKQQVRRQSPSSQGGKRKGWGTFSKISSLVIQGIWPWITMVAISTGTTSRCHLIAPPRTATPLSTPPRTNGFPLPKQGVLV